MYFSVLARCISQIFVTLPLATVGVVDTIDCGNQEQEVVCPTLFTLHTPAAQKLKKANKNTNINTNINTNTYEKTNTNINANTNENTHTRLTLPTAHSMCITVKKC